ncbi:hypothetical protein ACFPM0_21550 [Pseudonocardia sulfidoxydans]
MVPRPVGVVGRAPPPRERPGAAAEARRHGQTGGLSPQATRSAAQRP